MENLTHTLTSESVSEGHPDKVCDYIADSILDAYLSQDPGSRVACEVLCKDDKVVLAGEISSRATVDHDRVAREAIRSIGYVFDDEAFHADRVRVLQFISKQSDNIAQGVDEGRGLDKEQGAGDQGMMFGYATSETPELMPLPIVLAHRLTKGLADDRRSGQYPWLRPDAKSQVSVEYVNGAPSRVTTVLVSTQHDAATEHAEIEDYVKSCLAPRVLDGWFTPEVRVLVNPTGCFAIGGPSADCGVTGRKIIVDTLRRRGAARRRRVQRQGPVQGGPQRRLLLPVRRPPGRAGGDRAARRGAGGLRNRQGAAGLHQGRDLRHRRRARRAPEGRRVRFPPGGHHRARCSLLRPIYRRTTNYGHFGKPGLPWEA